MTSQQQFEQAVQWHRAGRLDEALTAYGQVLARQQAHAGALHFSALILYQQGTHDLALKRLQRSAQIDGSSPDVWSNLALVLQGMGRLDDAARALRQAVQRDPRLAPVWNNLAGLELQRGRTADAHAAALRATTLAPGQPQVWYTLALACDAQGLLDDALVAVSRAAQADPLCNGLKADLELRINQPDAALRSANAGLAVAEDPTLLLLRARALDALGQPEEALASYAHAHALAPDRGAILSEYLFLKKRLCDWQGLAVLQQAFQAGVAAAQPDLTPFQFLGDPSTRAEQRRCAETWSRRFQQAPPAPRTDRKPGRIRIGYLSADLHEHATAVLAAGLFEAHDRRQFEVTAYSTGPDDGSAMRRRLVAGFKHFVDARHWPDARLAQRIRDDGIDILVDLKGHTEHAPTGVLALRPATIQVNYLGYPGTMGAPWIDYLIGDAVVTPFAHAADYSETLVQLPHSYQINDRQRSVGAVVGRIALGLPEDRFVFCCFNQTSKLNPQVFDAWARILAAVPHSVLWLLSRGKDDAVTERLRVEMAARGIDRERLVFAQHRPHDEYMALYACADLFLDTWPYNAHTTASDALWAACPVLTWLGDTFAGRVAASLLTAAGLPQLVAGNVDDYVQHAVTLAQDPAALAGLKAHLLEGGRSQPLFDTLETTRALESAYIAMIEQQKTGQRAAFRVS